MAGPRSKNISFRQREVKMKNKQRIFEQSSVKVREVRSTLFYEKFLAPCACGAKDEFRRVQEKALHGFVLQMLEKWPWRASKRARSHKGNERGQTPERCAHGPHSGNARDPPLGQSLAGSQRLKQCSGKRPNILRMCRI